MCSDSAVEISGKRVPGQRLPVWPSISALQKVDEMKEEEGGLVISTGEAIDHFFLQNNFRK